MDSRPHDSPGPAPLVSVVIATHRRPDRLEALLKSLADQTIGVDRFEVIPVDDCSGDQTGAVLEALALEVPYALRPMRTPANRGPGPARNIGWRAARAPFIAFTDDDCAPDPDWLEEGVRALEADEHLGVVQGRVGPIDRTPLMQNRWNHSIIIEGPSAYFETCNIFYRKQALEDGGGFGEHYNWWGGWYCEDTFAGWRAVDQGWGRGYAPKARVVTEVERRSVKWWFKKSLALYIEVEVARRHPGFRAEAFWRPWSPRKHDAAFVLGCAGLVVAVMRRWPWAAALALPYMVVRRPGVRYGQFAQQCVETVIVDTARTAGILYGAVKEGIAVV